MLTLDQAQDCLSLENLHHLAVEFVAILKPGDVCFLNGEMGSGKTTFTREVFLLLKGDERIFSSPSFSLVNIYPLGSRSFYHVDLYRLQGLSSMDDLDRECWWSHQDDYSFIEWPERLSGELPKKGFFIEFEHLKKGRRIKFSRF